MQAQESKEFKKLLLSKRRILAGDVDVMHEETLKKTRQEATGNLSKMPRDMADIGTDNFEQDMTLELIENDEATLREIDEAIRRIADKTYGTCPSCNKSIKKTRLRALPHAKHCIKCQRLEEKDML
ncbi:MAG: TraR/DksA family transcriptional regulator [Planctomycetia bacterium]|nr:TraR/DksA family transcriptional regulator [Planctomycetia bacterium]